MGFCTGRPRQHLSVMQAWWCSLIYMDKKYYPVPYDVKSFALAILSTRILLAEFVHRPDFCKRNRVVILLINTTLLLLSTDGPYLGPRKGENWLPSHLEINEISVRSFIPAGSIFILSMNIRIINHSAHPLPVWNCSCSRYGSSCKLK